MIRRLISLALVAWVFGFLWFAVALPRPASIAQKTDAIVVATGAGGRIERGITLLRASAAPRMLVTGVDPAVRPEDFVHQYSVPQPLLECCITLGFAAFDTRSNGRETADWVARYNVRSVRLVTSDWHMRRFALEVGGRLPRSVRIVRDAVHTQPSLWTLILEYHKLMAAWLASIL